MAGLKTRKQSKASKQNIRNVMKEKLRQRDVIMEPIGASFLPQQISAGAILVENGIVRVPVKNEPIRVGENVPTLKNKRRLSVLMLEKKKKLAQKRRLNRVVLGECKLASVNILPLPGKKPDTIPPTSSDPEKCEFAVREPDLEQIDGGREATPKKKNPVLCEKISGPKIVKEENEEIPESSLHFPIDILPLSSDQNAHKLEDGVPTSDMKNNPSSSKVSNQVLLESEINEEPVEIHPALGNQEETQKDRTTPKKRKEPVQQNPSPTTSYICDVCETDFKYETCLSRHQRFGCKGPSQCPYCLTRYRGPEMLRHHIRKAHPQFFQEWFTMCYQEKSENRK